MHGKPALISLSRSQWTVTLLFLAFLLSALHSLLQHHSDKTGCGHVWMYPTYTKLTGFNKHHTRLGDKYALYLYRDDYYQRPESGEFKPTGVPVIFIPGNAGSYKQARSIGSLAAEVIAERGLSTNMQLDLFTADFQEDFTAFHGRTLLDQAEYVNDAIKFILDLYDNPNPTSPHPKSVIVIGHSMGGFIARALVGLNNYTPESVNTILTLASPHALPPLTFDAELTSVYRLVNRYWTEAHSANMIGRSPLSSVALVSIAGGKLDNMVPSDYAAVSEFARSSHAFTAFSYGIPGVWTGIDHQAIVWCHQARTAIVNALLDIVDPESPSKTKSLEARMRVFAHYFLSGFEPYAYNSKVVTPSTALTKAENVVPVDDLINILGPTSPNEKPTLIKVNAGNGVQIFSNVSDVDIQLCSAKLMCRGVGKDLLKIPHSSSYFQEPFQSGYKMKQPSTFAYYLEFTAEQLDGVSYVSVESKASMTGDDYILINSGVKQREIEVNASYMFFGGISVRVPAGQATDISLSGATSSLLSYTVELVDEGQKFSKGMFSPFVRQYVLNPFESKFHVNVFGKARRAFVFFHGLDSPFIGHTSQSTKNTREDNLHVQVFTPPTVKTDNGSNSFEVRVQLDVWGSIGNFVPRYRTILIPFSIAVVLSVIFLQVHFLVMQGSSSFGAGLKKKQNFRGVPTFSQGLQMIIRAFLPLGVPVLMLLQFLISFRPFRFVANLILQAPFLFRNGGVYTTATHLVMATESSENADMVVAAVKPGNPFFVGLVIDRHNLLLLFVAPLLVFLALGMTVTVHSLIMGLINGFVRLIVTISARSRVNDKKNKPAVSFGVSIGGQRVSYQWLVGAGLAISVTNFYAPYPLVYTALVVYFIYLFVLAKLNRQQHVTAQQHQQLQYDAFMNIVESVLMLLLWTVPLGIPVVVSWVHTLIEHSFLQPCSSHRNVVNIIPLLLVLYLFQTRYLTASSFLSASTTPASSTVITSNRYASQVRAWGVSFFRAFTAYLIFYALMLGFNNTYMVFHLVNIGLVCVAIYGFLLSN